MLITKRSPFTGKFFTLDVPVTQEQLDRWQAGELIQNVMPDLSSTHREFLITGLSPEDQDSVFGPDEFDDPTPFIG